jgi:HYR domain
MTSTALSSLSLCGTLGVLFLGAAPLPASAQPTNLARNRPYTLTPPPNYALTTDAADDMQLTDGAYTAGTLWTHTSTVGWQNATPVTIVIDLQRIQAIAGVSYSTAAGTAGVQWPRSIFVLTSDDGQHYFPAADLAAIASGEPGPPASGYSTFRFSTADLRTHGRYVAILVDQNGPYTFCDEIEILGGDPGWLASPLAGEMATNLPSYFVSAHMRVSIRSRLSSDLQDARTALAASSVDDGLRARLAGILDQAEVEIPDIPASDPKGFTTILPLNDVHARIFGVQGAIAHAEGFPALSAWAASPWDFIRPLEKPPISGGPGAVRIAAMNGETRAGAVNFANATDQATTVSLQLTDVMGTAGESDVRLYHVPWTDTRELVAVADALIPLPSTGATFEVPAGMTRQIWMSFSVQNRSPGLHRGYLDASVNGALVAHVPFELTVFTGTFPARPSLHLGGWDYTDRQNILGVTATNVGAFVTQLHALNVDAPWATSSVMPTGTFDAAGQMLKGPDASMFDQWVANWPGASQYFVFVSAHGSLGTVPVASSGPFATAIAQWITFWVAHAAQLGIQPSQLMLLLVDEPATAAQDALAATWAAAIKAAQPGVGIWEDPNFTDPVNAAPRLLDVTDVVALKRSQMAKYGVPFVQFYQQWATGARALNVYGASGPARLLDPYAYDRLQAWICADIGASGSFFWSFADDAGGASWNEYRTVQAPYSPFFISDTQVTISKHSEAIREGIEDFEYLAMLRPQPAAAGQDAASLYQQALDTVLRAPGASDQQWASNKDRSAADSMRLLIADALGLVSPLLPPAIGPVNDLIVEATTAAGAVVTYASPATLDAADGPGVASCAPASAGTFPLGVTTVTCAAHDIAGQTSSTSFTIDVRDTTAPDIGEVADIISEAASAAGTSVAFAIPGTTDAVDGVGTASCVPGSPGMFPVGETAVTCTANDSSGNASSRTFHVVVRDTRPPVISPTSDVTAEATSQAGAAVFYVVPPTFDSVDGNGAAACAPAPGSMFPLGTTMVVCSAHDAAGNSASSVLSVTVLDTTPPVITAMADVWLDATSAAGALVRYTTPSTSDLVDGDGTASCVPASGSAVAPGSTRVTCTARDASGNASTSAFDVIVAAPPPPVFRRHTREENDVPRRNAGSRRPFPHGIN